MYRVHSQILLSNGANTNPPIISPYSSSSSYTSSPSVPYVSNHQKESALSPTSSSGNKISPAILFIIVVLAVVFFILGLLHLLVRFIIKQRSSNSSISQSNRYPDMFESDAYQRQLQQLFHLHDSGLDQAFIDALPVFFYKEIIGLKEPFDCAVCLCEFLEQDKLRLLPVCNHAFHIECIDTWLLSNSTCPLCRGTLYSPGFAFENLAFDFESQHEEDGMSGSGVGGLRAGSFNKTVESHIVNGKRVFSVRLGKFRSTNNGDGVERSEGESSSGNLDVRRCYSMGSFQYVVGDSDLRVALGPPRGDGGSSDSMRQLKGRAAPNGSSFIDGDVEGKKISIARKGESFSVSKIWQWSRKDKLTGSSDTHFHTSTLPWMNKARVTELVNCAINVIRQCPLNERINLESVSLKEKGDESEVKLGLLFGCCGFLLEAWLLFSFFGLERSESYKGRILFLVVLGDSCVRRPSMEVILFGWFSNHMTPNGGELKCGVQQIFRSGLWSLEWMVVKKGKTKRSDCIDFKFKPKSGSDAPTIPSSFEGMKHENCTSNYGELGKTKDFAHRLNDP
ncbi:unnamed protein product [Sphenostylis stenocarpa]|uniref:RING-type E3 ubiquitin transferase n=1 Tax=Sphenostylis stenocarpa TaxID=92480 RepID=A0AA86SJ68_9FABA|nr:unnamed protein product [Sphenostylis stenocarpa]